MDLLTRLYDAIATPTGVSAEVAERLPTAPPLCIAFHDQAPITRA